MKDIEQSMKRALVEQGWIFGDKVTRIGSPFEWSENERKANILNLKNVMAIGFYFSMYYVRKPTPDLIRVDGYEEIEEFCKTRMSDAFQHYFPFLPLNASWQNHIESQAMARTQDCCFIKKYCPDLPDGPAHIDIGPGLGSSAVYSLKFLDSVFYALEAHPMSYGVQRDFFKFLSPYPGAYLDVVECENFQLTRDEILRQLNETSRYRLKHVPTWRFPLLPSESMDLLTATFVLNELNYAGILWLLAEGTRVLRPGGYFYIRDSFILKPGMHAIDYDKALTQLGFRKSARLEFENRHDFFGIPRLYQKVDPKTYSFEELVEKYLGKYASVASGANYAYNLSSDPQADQ